MTTAQQARGVLFVHSACSAVCPHVEWAASGVLGDRVRLQWTPQPAEAGAYRAELSWQAAPGTAGRLASALRGWERLRFEVTEDASPLVEGARYCYTPELGVFHAMTSTHGDIVVPEDRIRAALRQAATGTAGVDAIGGGSAGLYRAMQDLLGAAWDAELEPFRHAGDGAAVRWLHRVG